LFCEGDAAVEERRNHMVRQELDLSGKGANWWSETLATKNEINKRTAKLMLSKYRLRLPPDLVLLFILHVIVWANASDSTTGQHTVLLPAILVLIELPPLHRNFLVLHMWRAKAIAGEKN
jgi:hypothetical protein